jgi:hypothetical protein
LLVKLLPLSVNNILMGKEKGIALRQNRQLRLPQLASWPSDWQSPGYTISSFPAAVSATASKALPSFFSPSLK